MAGHDGQGSSRASSQGAKARRANRRVAQWTRDYVRLPGIPDEYIGQDGAPRAVWTRFFDAFAALTPGRNRAAFRLRRPASARSRSNLSRPRRNRRPALAVEPSAAADRRDRLAAIDRRHRAARRIARTGAERPLWRGPAGGRGRDTRGGDCRQHRISALGVRRQAAGRPLSRTLCRRCRARARRALVGAGRPHPGAVRRGLRAGKPAGAVARLSLALQIDERRARRAVLRGVPRLPARQRRPRRAAHRIADAGHLQRNLFRARHAGALSRLSAGRGRRSRRQRRPHPYPHRRRPEAARRAAAPGRFQFARSAGAGCLLAARRARPDRRACARTASWSPTCRAPA